MTLDELEQRIALAQRLITEAPRLGKDTSRIEEKLKGLVAEVVISGQCRGCFFLGFDKDKTPTLCLAQKKKLTHRVEDCSCFKSNAQGIGELFEKLKAEDPLLLPWAGRA